MKMSLFEMLFDEEGKELCILMWLEGEGNRPVVLERKDFERMWKVLSHSQRKSGKKGKVK